MIVDNQIIDGIVKRVSNEERKALLAGSTILLMKRKPTLLTPFKVYLADKSGAFAEAVCTNIIDGNAGVGSWVFITEHCGLEGYKCDKYCKQKGTEIDYPFGLHLTDIKMYDIPKQANAFTLTGHCFNSEKVEIVENCFGEYVGQYRKNSFCRICKYYDSDWGDCEKRHRPLTAIPKNFCYVEALEWANSD